MTLTDYGITEERYKELQRICELYPVWNAAGEETEKVLMIEQAAAEADAEIQRQIILSTCYKTPISYLVEVQRMPCSTSAFKDRRKEFYHILSRKLDKAEMHEQKYEYKC